MSYDPNNIFAQILRGQAPCIKVFEDQMTLVFMDIMPQADGHLLVIPKEPASQIFELSDDAAAACMLTARKAAIAVRAALHPPGMILAQANGSAAGQTVPHFHIHVIPRHSGEFLAPHAAQREDTEKLKELAKRIIAAWPELDESH
ncbi:histidine triad (HIT) protein [Pseudogulbenkiania sp. NH8B]|uniref:HIT family protein n=1 Tax=Pseudogulbenkiania sp. (strain NH8B) TaxID=748280 RepID=UPI0002279F8F|nr:HIT family protein [Pseudogulbenkiania sp. NH8B]BAK77235.1 histidine triad (HIT) protein [Pseudogulbenkiania sp. NH8B]